MAGWPLQVILPPLAAAIDASALCSQEEAAIPVLSGSAVPSSAETTRVMPTSTMRVAGGEKASVTTSAVVGARASAASNAELVDAAAWLLLLHTGLSRAGPPMLAKRMRTPPGGSSEPMSMLVMADGRVVAVAVTLAEAVAVAVDDTGVALAVADAFMVRGEVMDGVAPVDSVAVGELILKLPVLVVDAEAPNEWLAVDVSDGT